MKTEDKVKKAFEEWEWRFEIDGLPSSISMKTKDIFVNEVNKYFLVIKCQH